MANFKTGRSCTEFIPLSGMAPGAFLSYQVCGNFSFQVTKYVEDGVAYVAGYCMYIWSPYASSIDFSYKHIEKCIKAMPKYQLRTQSGALPPQELCFLACEDKSKAVRIMENLKLAFCQVLQKPVMIGTDNGVIKHFEWHSRCFMVSECASCCLAILEEYPPSYQSLITP